METLNEIKLDVNQHRLLMCMRMAKSLGKGEVYLDATSHKMCWKLEEDDRVSSRFRSIDELERYLEHLLEVRIRIDPKGLDNIHPSVRRRMEVVKERKYARTNHVPMTFHSRINYR